ncbi:hypothetical protein L1077_23160 [Pseudoalteromonas luteoviolacea]|uniref:hypothetical protein n=1 Tax=Pseudoalteromonas luteoviolacea TaxID=43657 RepID=UPI001F33F82B|nr:hypothetical protein [Pseudoalteromonas luteoviolacea]MCF6442330.1 hypothetical protein [Pseudoalteromonas luteoviolacea]
MIAQPLNNQVQESTPQLKAIDGGKRPIPQGLKDIHKLFGDARHTPGHVYTTMLNDNERQLLTFVAGFNRIEQGKPWDQMTHDQRVELRKALMFINNIVIAFIDANAMAPHKFYTNAAPDEVNYNPAY